MLFVQVFAFTLPRGPEPRRALPRKKIQAFGNPSEYNFNRFPGFTDTLLQNIDQYRYEGSLAFHRVSTEGTSVATLFSVTDSHGEKARISLLLHRMQGIREPIDFHS
ncbi:uncharacterized protein ARMOST_13677 [Armillaria ostoyae]|uniref:Uncharacterized protein n=1 Tax=Armillaria ostoyae TaxID=47428 RepID=A0A284RND7_ARMOS|nr:uncharacterized protein ARMOST_13677 [Armillaria ostoyae]